MVPLLRRGRRMDADQGAVPLGDRPAYLRDVRDVVSAMGSDASSGLTAGEAAGRLSQYGANEITGEPPPSVWHVALGQLREPMTLMLVAVAVVSIVIGQGSTGRRDRPGPAQRRDGHQPGAQGPGQRRRAGQPAGAAGPGDARRQLTSCRRPTSFPGTWCRWRPATSCRRTDASWSPRRSRRRSPP